MSVVDIMASFLCPEHPSIFLIHTPDLDRAGKDGGRFDGVVARLVVPPTPGNDAAVSPFWYYDPRSNARILRSVVLWLVLLMAPLGIAGGLTGFRSGESSTAAQRGWIMSWLVVGSLSSLWVAMVGSIMGSTPYNGTRGARSVAFTLLSTLPFWVPAIGGMVTVGLQLSSAFLTNQIKPNRTYVWFDLAA